MIENLIPIFGPLVGVLTGGLLTFWIQTSTQRENREKDFRDLKRQKGEELYLTLLEVEQQFKKVFRDASDFISSKSYGHTEEIKNIPAISRFEMIMNLYFSHSSIREKYSDFDRERRKFMKTVFDMRFEIGRGKETQSDQDYSMDLLDALDSLQEAIKALAVEISNNGIFKAS